MLCALRGSALLPPVLLRCGASRQQQMLLPVAAPPVKKQMRQGRSPVASAILK